MKAPETKPQVELVGTSGNAFSVLGIVKKELQKAGADKEYISKYIKEATSRDYNHLLAVTLKYVDAY